MDSACVYEQQTAINELTQGIQMAKELRANLRSAEARQFFIQKILSSYENALSALKSSDPTAQPWGTALPAQSLPDSSISNASQQSGEFEADQSFFDHQGQNVVSRKRKGLTAWEDEDRMCTDNNVLEMAYYGKRACNQGAGLAASPPPPSSPEKYEIKPTHNHQLYHDLTLPVPSEALSNLKANLSVNTSDFSTIVPSIFSIPSTPFGFMEDFQPNHFLNYVDDELLQVYSPPFISPDTSESNYLPEWGSSHSLDFSAEPAHVDPDFQSSNSFFLDKNDDPKFCRQVSWIGTLPF